MKTTIEQIEKNLKNTNEWIINVICPSEGAIMVLNNAYTECISTYRKNSDGTYKFDRVMGYTEAAKAPLTAMISSHNASEKNQKEAEAFDFTKVIR